MTILKPELTVFMPVYNGERYLADSLESLLTQSFRNFELLIVDDGSTDRTVEIAERHRRRDTRVRLIRGSHSGEVAARNKALSASHPETRYFLNHDADDISLPGKLEALVQHLETHPNIGIVGTLAEYFNHTGRLGEPPIHM